jgi:tetratricopeptide (TPR) repeat protein
MWYLARRFDLAIRWGLRALELDSQNLRAGSILAASYMEAGRRDESLRVAQSMYEMAPGICETNLVLGALLAQAGQHGEALHAFRSWERRRARAINLR